MRSQIRFLICGLFVFAVHTMWSATAFSSPGPLQQKYLFGQAQFSTGSQPVSIATGDFNGDGILDFAVVNTSDSTVSIVLGNPDGTFAPRVDYPTGSDPVVVLTGDFNGDGKLDLAIARLIVDAQEDGGVAVMLGNGDGTFQPPVDYPLANFRISALTTGDFNGDGNLDVVAVSYCQSCSGLAAKQVSVLLGNGDGTLRAPVQYLTGSGANSVVSGDFNGDGKRDLAVTFGGDPPSSPGGVSILLGNGDGTFQAPIDYSLGAFTFPSSIVAADFDSDGTLDLAVSAPSATWFLHGFGNGKFGTPVVIGPAGSFLMKGDWNGDGKADIAVIGGGITFLLGKGDGTFQTAISYGVGSNPAAAAAGDFNRDGVLDVIIANTGNNTASILLGNGDGTFTSERNASSLSSLGVAPEDFNGDGKIDLALIDSSGVSILIGNGDGSFRAGQTYPLANCASIIAADFNRDGRMDLAVTHANGNVAILIGDGDGTFQDPIDYPVGVGPEGLAIGDFNRDGKLDLVVANAGFSNNKYTGSTVSILLGNGDGTFQAQKTYSTAVGPLSMAVSDLNRDGRLDLAVATATTFGVTSILLGNGDGTFQSSVNYVTSKDHNAQAHSIITADLNDDGDVDLVVADNTPNETGTPTGLAVLLGHGDGTFQPPAIQAPGVLIDPAAAPNAISQIAVADIDGDGKLDLISVGNQVAVQRGNGDGTFAPALLYGTAGGTAVAVADLDGDGTLDLAIAGRALTVFLNTPIAALSSSSVGFPVTQLHASSAPKTIVLGNPSPASLKILGIQITGDFSETNNCGVPLAAGTQCEIAITFLPQTAGTRTGMLSISDSSGTGRQNVPLSGVGTTQGPLVVLSPTSLTFVGVRVATVSNQTVQLLNSGNGPLTISSFTTTGEFSARNSCGSSLAAGDSCIFTVSFAPSSPETQTGSLTIADNGPGSPHTVSLTGTGESLAFSKTNLNFSTVVVGKTSSPQTVTLFNVGGGVVTLTGIVFAGPNAGDFQVIPNGPMTPNCAVPDTLRGQARCFISVTFTPTGSGPRAAQMSVGDDRDPLPLTLPLSGVGKPVGPIAKWSATSLSFGVVPDGSKKNTELQLTNIGDEPLSIVAIATLAEFSATNNCGSSVVAGASCTFTVTFAPTFGGTQSGNLSITDNAPGSPQTVSLTGIGENIEFNKTSLVFSTVPVGQTSTPQTVSLFSLSGNAIVTGMLTGPHATDFQLASSSCGPLGSPVEIRRGDPCKIVLTFTPTAKGSRAAQLIFTNNNGPEGTVPAVLPLSGDGS
jgi:FG-GAP-like repeat/Abnormal spindle-like microcephaly-assoc'd, ASPM-SPD-2-Hydin